MSDALKACTHMQTLPDMLTQVGVSQGVAGSVFRMTATNINQLQCIKALKVDELLDGQTQDAHHGGAGVDFR